MLQEANEQPTKGRGSVKNATARNSSILSFRLISSHNAFWQVTATAAAAGRQLAVVAIVEFCTASPFFVFAFALAACLSTFNLFAVLCNNCNFLLSQLPTPAMLRNGRDCCSCGGCFCCRCYVIILPLRVVLHVRAASSVTYKLMQLLKFVILHLPNSPAAQPHTHAHSTCGGIVRSGSPDGASKLSGTQKSNYGH